MSTGRLRDQVAGRYGDQIIERSKDVQRLNSYQKHIKLTLTGYSRLYSEWEQKNQ